MRRICGLSVALSLALSALFLALSHLCPMQLHGPDDYIHRIQAEIRFLGSVVTIYRRDHSQYPDDLADLADLIDISRASDRPLDPFGGEYIYRVEPTGTGFIIYSAGRNGVDEVGEGDDILLSGKQYDCPVFYRCRTVCEGARDAVFIGALLLWITTGLTLLSWCASAICGRIRRGLR